MKRILMLLIAISATQFTFSQPPHPGNDPNNSTSGKRPERSVNATNETPLATGTTLLVGLAFGFTAYNVRKKGKR